MEHGQSQRAYSSLTDYKSFAGLLGQKTVDLWLRPIVPSTQYLLPRDSVPQSGKLQVFRPWAQLTSRPPCSAAPTPGLVGKREHRRAPERQKDGGAAPKKPRWRERVCLSVMCRGLPGEGARRHALHESLALLRTTGSRRRLNGGSREDPGLVCCGMYRDRWHRRPENCCRNWSHGGPGHGEDRFRIPLRIVSL